MKNLSIGMKNLPYWYEEILFYLKENPFCYNEFPF